MLGQRMDNCYFGADSFFFATSQAITMVSATHAAIAHEENTAGTNSQTNKTNKATQP